MTEADGNLRRLQSWFFSLFPLHQFLLKQRWKITTSPTH